MISKLFRAGSLKLIHLTQNSQKLCKIEREISGGK